MTTISSSPPQLQMLLAELFTLFTRDASGRWCFNSLSRDGGKFDSVMERLSALATPPVAARVDDGMDTNWPLRDVLTQGAEWLRHLNDHHNCDCHGWEARSFIIEAAERYAAAAPDPLSQPATRVDSAAPTVDNQALIQLLDAALVHPESAEPNIRQIIELLATTATAAPAEQSAPVVSDNAGMVQWQREQSEKLNTVAATGDDEGDHSLDYAYAVRLATVLRDNFYADNQDWQPLTTLNGVMSQIDNMIAGLLRKKNSVRTFRIEEPRGPF